MLPIDSRLGLTLSVFARGPEFNPRLDPAIFAIFGEIPFLVIFGAISIRRRQRELLVQAQHYPAHRHRQIHEPMLHDELGV